MKKCTYICIANYLNTYTFYDYDLSPSQRECVEQRMRLHKTFLITMFTCILLMPQRILTFPNTVLACSWKKSLRVHVPDDTVVVA